MSRVSLIRSAAGIATFYGLERLGLGAGPVPASADALTAQWLTDALCRERPGAVVERAEVGGGSDGTSARRALTVTYNAEGTAAGLPTKVYTKSSPGLMTRMFTGLSDLGTNEIGFYLRIRPLLEIETPYAYRGAVDRRRGTSMLLMEDIADSRGATFADPTVTVVDRANADRMVELMAGYHGPLWEDPRLDGQWTWLKRSEDFQQVLNDNMGFRKMFDNGIERAHHLLPTALAARADELWSALQRTLELRAAAPQTLLHQDTHARNWYFRADGHIGLYDWQANGKGLWAVDVAYALACGLRIEDRRAWERDLLALYVERLAEHGGPTISVDDAFTAYRQQLLHGFGYWLATIGVTRFQPELQPREVCLANIERLATAVDDLDTLDGLR